MLTLINSKVNRSRKPMPHLKARGLSEPGWVSTQFGTTLIDAGLDIEDESDKQYPVPTPTGHALAPLREQPEITPEQVAEALRDWDAKAPRGWQGLLETEKAEGAKYSADQPREPAGGPGGGRWTSSIRDYGNATRGIPGGAWWERSEGEKESYEWAKENWSPYSQGVNVSAGDSKAIEEYMTKEYDNLNRSLRGNDRLSASQKKIQRALDKVTTSTSAPEDVYVYRAVRPEYRPGDIEEDKGFSSTSLLRDIAVDFVDSYAEAGHERKVARIHVPHGTPSAFIANFAPDKGTRFQQEVLFPRGTKFRIISVGDEIEMVVERSEGG